MEKFRIAMYGMTQVTAIVYGVLASGTVLKVSHPWPNLVDPTPPSFNLGMFYRDHGYYLLILVVAWAVATSYMSSDWSQNRIDEGAITKSGLGLTIFYAILGTFLAFMAAMPQPVLVGHP